MPQSRATTSPDLLALALGFLKLLLYPLVTHADIIECATEVRNVKFTQIVIEEEFLTD